MPASPDSTHGEEPYVSVIIPTHNRAALVVEAIESVLAQSYQDFEIIVVDDGSTDDTRTVLAPYAHRIRYISQEHRGRSAARNTGLRCARGQYIVFLDSDDLLLPCKLATQIEFLQTNQRVAVVYGDGFILGGDGSLGPLQPYVRRLPPLDQVSMTALLMRGNLFALHTATVRRSAVDGMRFDESLEALEDWDFWIRLALAGATLRYQAARVAVYRRHDRNTDVRNPESVVRARTSICARIVAEDLDRHLPARLRQDFRIQQIGALARSRDRRVIATAFRTILYPDQRLSVYGLAALARRAAALSLRVGTRRWRRNRIAPPRPAARGSAAPTPSLRESRP